MIKKYINLLIILLALPAILVLCLFYLKPEFSIFILVFIFAYAMFLESPTKSTFFFEVPKFMKFFFNKGNVNDAQIKEEEEERKKEEEKEKVIEDIPREVES